MGFTSGWKQPDIAKLFQLCFEGTLAFQPQSPPERAKTPPRCLICLSIGQKVEASPGAMLLGHPEASGVPSRQVVEAKRLALIDTDDTDDTSEAFWISGHRYKNVSLVDSKFSVTSCQGRVTSSCDSPHLVMISCTPVEPLAWWQSFWQAENREQLGAKAPPQHYEHLVFPRLPGDMSTNTL